MSTLRKPMMACGLADDFEAALDGPAELQAGGVLLVGDVGGEGLDFRRGREHVGEELAGFRRHRGVLYGGWQLHGNADWSRRRVRRDRRFGRGVVRGRA